MTADLAVYTAVEIYNAGRGGKKLASWWREDSELELVRDTA